MLNIYTFPSTNHRWKTSLFQWLNWIRHFDERTCRVFYVYHLEYEFTLRKSSLYCKTFVYVRSKILKTECIDNQKDTKAIKLHLDLWSVIIVHDSSNRLWTRLDLCCAVFVILSSSRGKKRRFLSYVEVIHGSLVGCLGVFVYRRPLNSRAYRHMLDIRACALLLNNCTIWEKTL